MLLQNGWICSMDDSGAEHEDGWVLVRDGLVEAGGGGTAPGGGSGVALAGGCGRGQPPAADSVVALRGGVVTPGLVNTHHHLYQTLTRARAQEATLFEWLRELYPGWARTGAAAEHCAAA